MKQRLRARFRVMTVLQVVLLACTIAALVTTLLKTNYMAVPILLLLMAVLQIVLLVRSVQAHVQALEEFFAAVNYEDFTRRFVEDDLDAELKDAFNKVIERFQDARADRDMQAGYLDTVIRHVPVPFMAARDDGKLSLVNAPARRLTGLPGLAHMEDLRALDNTLPERLAAIGPGKQRLLQTTIRGLPAELRVSVSQIRMRGAIERLYSIENLSGELSARESSAWRNLIRVLTHEIMNTLTPITSLAQTTVDMLDDSVELGSEGADIREAVATIGRRGEGLIRFIAGYRELLKVPEPKAENFAIRPALEAVAALLQSTLANTELNITVTPATLEVYADRHLFDQVLINLVKNAAESIGATEGGEIRLAARLDYGRVLVDVTDNGGGIAAEDIDQVFIPFFTTKREGSGIGLSFCREIMAAHGGEITIESSSDGTTARLIFP